MRFSFLMPIYKAEFLEYSLKSILNQTYNENFEIILSDDCSPYDLKGIIDKFNDKRIKYNRNKYNIGANKLAEHWNMLLSMAQGDYIIVASDDDIYESDFLQKMDCLINKYPGVNIFRARVRNINAENEAIWEDLMYPEYQDEFSAICSYSTVCIGNYVFKKDVLIKNGGFLNLPYAMGSDTGTAILMSKYGMVNSLDILFNYRISDAQVSHRSRDKIRDKGKLNAALDFHLWMKNYIDNISYERTKLNRIKIDTFVKKHIKGGFLHCSRLYYGALNIKEFCRLYKFLKSEDCFSRKTDELVFIIDYLHSRRYY